MDSLVDVTFKIPKRHLLGLDVYAESIGVTRDKLLAGFVRDELNYVSLDKLDTPVDNELVLKPWHEADMPLDSDKGDRETDNVGEQRRRVETLYVSPMQEEKQN